MHGYVTIFYSNKKIYYTNQVYEHRSTYTLHKMGHLNPGFSTCSACELHIQQIWIILGQTMEIMLVKYDSNITLLFACYQNRKWEPRWIIIELCIQQIWIIRGQTMEIMLVKCDSNITLLFACYWNRKWEPRRIIIDVLGSTLLCIVTKCNTLYLPRPTISWCVSYSKHPIFYKIPSHHFYKNVHRD
jgi:hypothetical protein